MITTKVFRVAAAAPEGWTKCSSSGATNAQPAQPIPREAMVTPS
jgi:hypothetical protein